MEYTEDSLIDHSSDPIESEKTQEIRELERRLESQRDMKDVMIMYYLMKQNKERID